MLPTIPKLATLGLVLGIAATSTVAMATPRPPKPHAVPEISTTHAGAALALILGGVAVVLGRRRRQVA